MAESMARIVRRQFSLGCVHERSVAVRFAVACCLSIVSSTGLAQKPPGAGLTLYGSGDASLNASANVVRIPLPSPISLPAIRNFVAPRLSPVATQTPTVRITPTQTTVIAHVTQSAAGASLTGCEASPSACTGMAANLAPAVRSNILNTSASTILVTGDGWAGNLARIRVPGGPAIAARAVVDSAGHVRLIGDTK